MMKRNFLKLLDAFNRIQSDLDCVIPDSVIDDIAATRLEMQVMEGPFRDLGYIVIPRLTMSADSLVYFYFGCLLIGFARKAQVDGKISRFFDLNGGSESSVCGLALSVWNSEEGGDRGRDIFEFLGVDTDVSWLSPLSGFGLSEIDSPVVGIIRRRMGGYFLDEDVKTDGSVIGLSVSARGASALGNVFILFSIDADLDAVQFEQTQLCGGVARASYEIECLKKHSFASDALFNID